MKGNLSCDWSEFSFQVKEKRFFPIGGVKKKKWIKQKTGTKHDTFSPFWQFQLDGTAANVDIEKVKLGEI